MIPLLGCLCMVEADILGGGFAGCGPVGWVLRWF